MRWVGSLDVMAQQKQRAQHRGRVARRLLGELRPYAGVVATALGFVAVAATCQSIGPWIVSRAIDHDIMHHDAHGLLTHIAMLLGVWVASIAGMMR
jgi:ATP-binding cassette subfamily B protein/subfamily B ATP-binding cassette protein MsbA